MAQTIKLKRSAIAGRVPTVSDLALGELGINTYDGKLYIKKDVGGTESIVEVGNEAIWKQYVYTAGVAQTVFTGADDNSDTLRYSANYIEVFLNGILLDPAVDYTATNNTSVVLTSAPATGDLLQIDTFAKSVGVGDIELNSFTGDNSTTAFTLSTNPGDENNTSVFIGGVYQNKTTYSVSGTTLTFSEAPATAAEIEVVIGSRNVSLTDIADLSITGVLTASGGTSTNWNTAYGWGNHASAGYLTTDNDTTYSAGTGVTLTGTTFSLTDTAAKWTQDNTKISNWDTAYGWGDHSTATYATQSYVGTAISNLVDSSPATLDTLNELAAALGDDPNFATTTATAIGLKAPIASPTFTGTANATHMQVSNGGKYIFGGESTRITGEIDGSGKIRLFTGGTEKVILDGANVAIGTSSTGFNGQGLPLVVGSGTGNTGMTIFSGADSYGTLQFADAVTTGAASYAGVVSYNHTSNFMYFSTASTERMRIDSVGSVGIGVTPSTWASTVYDALQIGGSIGVGTIAGRRDGINQVNFGLNWNYDGGATLTYVGTSFATNYSQEAGTHRWSHAASGTAGGALTLTESMRIDASGNVGIGTSSPAEKLDISQSVNNSVITKVTNTNSGDLATARVEVHNNDSSFGQLTTYSSGFGYPVFGSSAANWTFIGSSGANSNGLKIGTLTLDPIVFGTNDTERMRIDSSGNLLVGTISGSGSRVYAAANNGGATVGDFRNTSATGFGMYIAGGDTASQYALRVADYANNPLMTVDGEGNLLMGVTSVPSGAGGVAPQLFLKQGASSNGISSMANGNNNFIRMLHTGDIGKIETTYATGSYTPLTFFTSGTERMRITSSGGIEIPNQNVVNELTFTGTEFTNIFSNTTSGFQLGTTGAGYLVFMTDNAERIRIDVSGHAIIPAGITLGTAVGVYDAAKTLDDYEEGTWTPVLTTNGSAPSVTYTAQLGTYTKVGRLVFVSGRLAWSAIGSYTGSLIINGLPFTILNSSGAYSQMTSVDYAGVTFGANDTTFGGYGAVNFTNIFLIVGKNNGTASTAISGLSTSGHIYFSLTYQQA